MPLSSEKVTGAYTMRRRRGSCCSVGPEGPEDLRLKRAIAAPVERPSPERLLDLERLGGMRCAGRRNGPRIQAFRKPALGEPCGGCAVEHANAQARAAPAKPLKVIDFRLADRPVEAAASHTARDDIPQPDTVL